MRGPDRKPRKLRPAPVRDGLVPSRARPRHLARLRVNAIALLAGNCVCCFKPRGRNGTVRMCRRCADRHAAKERQRRLSEAAVTRPKGSKVLICICGRWFVKKPNTKAQTCGHCRAEAADRRARERVNTEPEPKMVVCENCFAEFKRAEQGQRTFCDECLPWFEDVKNDKERGQDEANDWGIKGPHTIIDEWQRQG